MRTSIILALALLLVTSTSSVAQTDSDHSIYGDFKVDESKVTGAKPLSFDVILYTSGGDIVARQTVGNNSRYRFNEVPNGEYELVVEVENSEIARIHLMLNEGFKTDIRRDIELEWRENPGAKRSKAGVTPADSY